MVKTLILTEGGRNIGFGHITRCIALSQGFAEKNIDTEFIVNGDDTILNLLKGKKYQILNWLSGKSKLLELIKKADFIIIDSYLADQFFYKKISELFEGRIVMLDDYQRIRYPKGIVVSSSIYADKLKYLHRKGTTHLLGEDYIILRKPFWKVPKKLLNRKVKNIMVVLSGMGYKELVEEIVLYLRQRVDKDIKFNILLPEREYLSANKMKRLMMSADICISGGGQITYELARCGIPTIGICFAKNQLLNLEYWSKEGFLNFVGWWNDANLYERIKKAMTGMSYRKRLQMNKIGRKFVDGQGVRRLVKKILNFIKK